MMIKFKPVPTILVTLGFVILMSLGIWQLERMAFKDRMIADITEKASQNSVSFPKGLKPTPAEEYKKYKLKGRFIEGKDMFLFSHNYLTPRGHGLSILTPFLTTDGEYIIVNRGWTKGKKHPETLPKKTNGEIEITTIITPRGPRGAFLPKNLLDQNLWLAPDIEEMKIFTGLDINTDMYMMMIEDNDQTIIDYHLLIPHHSDFTQIDSMQHKYYAITWFALAGILLLMAYSGARKAAKEEHQNLL